MVATGSIAGCLGGGQEQKQDNSDSSSEGVVVYKDVPDSGDVVRFVDREAGTVCYYFSKDGGYDGQGGLSCVPIEDTNFSDSTEP